MVVAPGPVHDAIQVKVVPTVGHHCHPVLQTYRAFSIAHILPSLEPSLQEECLSCCFRRQEGVEQKADRLMQGGTTTSALSPYIFLFQQIRVMMR